MLPMATRYMLRTRYIPTEFDMFAKANKKKELIKWLKMTDSKKSIHKVH